MHTEELKPPTPAVARRFTPFDRTVFAVLALLILLILATIALGDRVGVSVDAVTPLGEAHSTSPITIRFGERMQPQTVAERFRTEPALEGEFSWRGSTFVFQPDEPLSAGTDYTVILEGGAVSETGRAVISEYRYSFTVMPPRVAYLYPADGAPQNIWVVDPQNLDRARQLTNSPSGVYDFAVSPDGARIAFSERNTSGTMDIKLIDLDSGALIQLTNCQDSSCTTPVWRPDGGMIAYERVEHNSEFGEVGTSPARIWILDMSSLPPATRPLFDDLQILGVNAQWSADGSRIALFDRSSNAILVYDFTTGEIIGIPNTSGTSGALSPDGTRLVMSEVNFIEGEPVRVKMQIADLATNEIRDISSGDDPIDEKRAQWRPDGAALAVSRDDSRYYASTQIYLVDPDDGSSQPMTTDPLYANTFFWWNPSGTGLVIQRLPLLASGQTDPMVRPEIWVFDVETGEGIKVAENGFLPRWIP